MRRTIQWGEDEGDAEWKVVKVASVEGGACFMTLLVEEALH